MRPSWLAAALAALAIASVRPSAQPAPPAPPKLLVVLVVDQLRANDLDTYGGRWRDGFRTLLDQGARFTEAEYPYLNTATCAGHATIGTGSFPRTHGMVLNRWWDRQTRRVITCTDDESSPHVSYGAAAPFGNSAARLLAPTLGDELRSQHPGARVVSIALKARSAISLAGHGPAIATWFDETARSFVTSRAFSRDPVEAISRFIAGDSPASALGDSWGLTEPEASYRFADIRTGERPKSGWTSLFPHRIEGADGADAVFFDRWQKSPFANTYLARMASALVDDLQLGRRETTDLLAISFSPLDLLGHDFGPDSREAEDLLLRLDADIGGLLRQLDTALGRDGYAVALTSDHGTASIPEQSGGGRIASEDVLQLVEQTLAGRWGVSGGAPYVAWVGPGSIYFAEGVFERLKTDAAAFEEVAAALESVPGVERVLSSDALAAPDSDPDRHVRAALAGYLAGRSGDLFLVARRNWIFELRSENDATNHGTSHEYDRRVPLVLRGHRFRPGRYRGTVSPADIAPTLAFITGIRMPNAEGRALTEAIR